MRWLGPAPDAGGAAALAAQAGLAPLAAAVLWRRGIADAAAARAFLNPTLNDLLDPALLRGAREGARLLARAIGEKKRIVVYGDYDADGIAATALLVNFCRRRGAPAFWYLPHRLEEGYGLNPEALRKLAGEADLLVTVDCGISAVAEVALANELGLTVLVTDHHESGGERPAAAAVLNPKQPGCGYPFKDLSGVGVALKLAWETARVLCGSSRVDQDCREFLLEAVGLAALGTVADVVPLVGENRALVRYGLAVLARSRQPGVRALCAAAGLRPGAALKAHDVAFRLGPRLNAAGRLGSAEAAVELLTCADETRAGELAATLEAANRRRQQLEAAIAEEALAAAAKLDLERERAIVLWRDDWHPGVIGIVAARLVRRFHRPALLIGLEGEEGRGSARSLPGFHLYQALDACRDLLRRFGGHELAAGLALERRHLEEFRRRFLDRAAASLAPGDLLPQLEVDAAADFAWLTTAAVAELELLAPHGARNPRPLVATGGLTLASEPRRLGRDGQHLSFFLRRGERACRAIWFGGAAHAPPCAKGQLVAAAYVPRLDERNRGEVELEIQDLRPDEGPLFSGVVPAAVSGR